MKLIALFAAFALMAQLSQAQVYLVQPSFSWNLRKSAQSGICCEKFESMCEIRDLASCEALNECRGEAGPLIKCDELGGTEPMLQTKLFEYLCADKDVCQDELDDWCGDYKEQDLCMAHARCVMENTLLDEDREGLTEEEMEQYLDGACSGTGSSSDVNFLLYRSIHACDEIPCEKELADACADGGEDACKAFQECALPDFDESEWTWDDESDCGCSDLGDQLLSIFGYVPPAASKAVCDGDHTDKAAMMEACAEYEEYMKEEFPSSQEVESVCDAFEEVYGDDVGAALQRAMSCQCRSSGATALIVGAALAGVLLIGGGAAVAVLGVGGLSAKLRGGSGSEKSGEEGVEKKAVDDSATGDQSEVSEASGNAEAAE